VAGEAADQLDRASIAELSLERRDCAPACERAPSRIDWVAACVQGPRVLDVGCGEGVLAVLLARAGHRVVGVDVEPAAIAAAQRLLGDEPAPVRRRVALRLADARTADLDVGAFDTVVLGQVIGHLEDPSAMLERAFAWLKPGGRLVLTAPFGYAPPQRQEFRTTTLVSLLGARFVIDQLGIVAGDFRVRSHAITAPILQQRRAPDPNELLRITEEAAIAAQKQRSSALEPGSRRLASGSEREQALAEQERHLHDEVQRLTRQLERQKRVTATTQARMRQAQLDLKRLQKGLRQELGRAVEKSLGSPLGIFRLPLRIATAYRRARRRAEAGLFAPSSSDTQREPATPAPAGTKTRLSAPRGPRHRDISSAFPPYPFPERAPRCPVRVATILDEFSDSCFRYEAELIPLTKEGWREQIERHRPRFLFVESAWRGNRGNWRGLLNYATQVSDNPLAALVQYCQNRGIPTVFWNKEDPPNFDAFIEGAAIFDYVFTTDANCIERYRERLAHDRIAALPFAAQPAIHNPIGKQESEDYEIAFAGTWYGQKHEERGALLPILLDAAAAHKLHIFDRMSDYTQNDCYRFPDKYTAFLRTALAYPNVLNAYRNFKLFLNVNSVTDSPTMFARRVFEILASSTAVVSTASAGIERMLGDVVALVHDENEARAEFDRLLSDAAYRQRKAHLGYRKVTREHTYAARFRTIAHAIGLDLAPLGGSPVVSVVIPLAERRWFENALDNLRRQRHAPLEPVWVLRDGAASGVAERVAREDPSGVIIEVGAEATLEAMLRSGLEISRGALVTVFDPRDLYGPEFIGDLLLAMSYADAEMVGKGAYFTAPSFGEAPVLCQSSARYRYLDDVIATGWLARRDFVQRVGVDQILSVQDGARLMARANAAGRIYGADPYNYLRLAAADLTPGARAAPAESSSPSAMRYADIMI
jgi:spore maturation protein CgeB/2-polyprenyl-3-methyl-5-hydroxy-6-metoxy-1,4-benzoquinol methylase